MSAKTKMFTVNKNHNLFDIRGKKVFGWAKHPNNQAELDEVLASKLVKLGAIDVEIETFKNDEEVDALNAQLTELREANAKLTAADSTGKIEGDAATHTGEDGDDGDVDTNGGEPSGGTGLPEIPKAEGKDNSIPKRRRNL